MTTKTAQFTPGPWREYHTHGNWEMYGSNGQLLFRIKDGVIPMLNDAALIAAAPVMYEALKALVDVFPSVVKMAPYGVSMDISQLHDNAKAALSHAEGR